LKSFRNDFTNSYATTAELPYPERGLQRVRAPDLVLGDNPSLLD
jgi:hypothetical protein